MRMCNSALQATSVKGITVLQLHHVPQISKNGRNDQQRPVVLQRKSTRAMPQRCRSHMERIYQLVAGTEGNVCSGE